VSGIRRYQKSSAVARLALPIANAFAEHIADFVNHVSIQDGGGTLISIELFPQEKILSVPRDATPFYQRGTWIDWHAMIGYGQRGRLGYRMGTTLGWPYRQVGEGGSRYPREHQTWRTS
jgi:hypothetical protein